MRPDQPHNMAIAEFIHNAAVARITGKAATEHDDAIQLIVDFMAEARPHPCLLTATR